MNKDKSIYDVAIGAKGFYYTKTRKVKDPHRGTSYSAGIDFFIPEIDEKFIKDFTEKNYNNSSHYSFVDDNTLIVYPHGRILIPLGVYVKVPKNYCMIFFNKGGIASKKGFDVLACVVDEDYQGEVYLNFVNTGFSETTLQEGEKAIQGLLIHTIYFELKELPTLEDLYPEKTERGDGAFGSTNKK